MKQEKQGKPLVSKATSAKSVPQVDAPLVLGPLHGLPLNPKLIMQLQRTIGNQAVIQLLRQSSGVKNQPLKTLRMEKSTIQRKVGFEVEIPNPISRVKRTSHYGRGMDEKPKDGLTPLKGESIMVGYGWKMTPDGSGRDWKTWWLEFISDADDEETWPKALLHYAEDLVKYLTAVAMGGTLEKMDGVYYRKLDYKDYSIYINPLNLVGQFQITGGVKLDQLMTLLEVIIKQGFIGKQVGKLILSAKEHGDKSSPDPNYNNFVALLGTYIAGQYYKLGDTHDVPDSAKHNIAVLSKTRLGQVLKSLGYMPDFNKLVGDVIQASGEENLKGDSPLFPAGIAQKTNRGIDQKPDITITDWLTEVYKCVDENWSDTEYAMEDVGKKDGKKERAKGLVIELRELSDGSENMPYEKWPKFAETITDIFRIINESKSKK